MNKNLNIFTMINKKKQGGRELPESKKRRREKFITISALTILVILTVFSIYFSQFSRKLFIGNSVIFFALININIILLILVIFLVLRNLTKLFFERRRKILGSKLRTKLVFAFIALSLLPTSLLFFASVIFINNSIENWFNVQVENSLEESLKVAQVYYKNSQDNALYYARQLSQEARDKKLLNEQNLSILREFIKKKQKEYNLGAVEVFSSQLEELVKVINPNVSVKSLPSPKSNFVKRGLGGEEFSQIQPAGGGDLIIGIVPVYSTWKPQDVVGVIAVNYLIPSSLTGKMRDISATFEEYRQTKILTYSIKFNYFLVLALVTLLIIFAATWFGFFLAKGITIPIQQLASGTERVALGELDFRIEPVVDDELGTLVKSFNKMTQDLKSSRVGLKQANIELTNTNIELDRRRKYMEIVLRNVAAGVISIDKDGHITTINKSAEKILEVKPEKILNENFLDVLSSPYLEMVKKLVEDLEVSPAGSVSKEIELSLKRERLTLLANLSILKDEEENYMGMVAVFDDLTQLQKAQRVAAWREVAKRIAHEIKNPLTPIQLSAQRLRKKYLNRFTGDGKIFDECTGTIISQVDELKNLVNEFSSFARMPAINPMPNDLNRIIEEAVNLFKGAHKNVEIKFKKGSDLPIFELDKDQMKRVVINLLDNAVASIKNEGEKGVLIIESFYDHQLELVRFEIVDNGYGISPEVKARLFEPYFSTKKTGTGLGLAIIKTIISDHHGYIRVKDNKPRGTRFIIELPLII